jgi:hypothetical protein
MPIALQEVRELLKAPKNKKLIQKAYRQETRLRFHCETSMESSDIQDSCNQFFEWVKAILPTEKYKIFLSLFRFPVYTNDLTEQIFHALEKVFDGRDPYFDYDFVSPEALQDWQEYQKEKLKGQEHWQEKSFNVLKSAINSILIVDLERLSVNESGEISQDSFLPEPYAYFKPINTVHDFAIDEEGNIEYLIFLGKSDDQKVKELFVFDDQSYRVFKVTPEMELLASDPEIEAPHELGYCPAKFFWSDYLRESEKAIKKSPLSNQLSNLDKLLFKIISKDHLDLYASYPIYYGVEVECDYQHPENGEHCEGGYIKDIKNKYVIGASGYVQQCPVCSAKRFAGAGTYIEVPYPDKEAGVDYVSKPIDVVTIDKGSLEYNRDEVDNLSSLIYTNVVGYAGDLPGDQAVNKLQVAASYEDRQSVLVSFKKNLERIQQFRDETICRLRYGTDMFLGATISLGTEWYLSSVKELIEKYKAAKDAGAHDSELDSLQDQIMETEHRNNPTALQRAKIMSELEPFRHMTRTEVLNRAQDSNLFDPVQVAIKVNFSNFIARFERENTNIIEFGSLLSYDKKVSKIKLTLEDYVRERQNQEPEPEPVQREDPRRDS